MSDIKKNIITISKEKINLENSKLKDKDYLRLELIDDEPDKIVLKKIDRAIKFGYTISIRGTGYWDDLGKQRFVQIGYIDNYPSEALKNSLDKINDGFEDYTITIYLTSEILKKLNDERLKDSQFVKSDVKDKIYRAYDIEIDIEKIIINY